MLSRFYRLLLGRSVGSKEDEGSEWRNGGQLWLLDSDTQDRYRSSRTNGPLYQIRGLSASSLCYLGLGLLAMAVCVADRMASAGCGEPKMRLKSSATGDADNSLVYAHLMPIHSRMEVSNSLRRL